jgi:hypothetical protein
LGLLGSVDFLQPLKQASIKRKAAYVFIEKVLFTFLDSLYGIINESNPGVMV